jgi:hypothetical protein
MSPARVCNSVLRRKIGFESAVSHTVGLDQFGHYFANFASVSFETAAYRRGRLLLQVRSRLEHMQGSTSVMSDMYLLSQKERQVAADAIGPRPHDLSG